MKTKIGYLGPKGTFCEEAAHSWSTEEDQLIPCPSIEAVFAAVYQQETHSGIIPVENSCEGSVNQTLDLLAYNYDLKITGELVLPVKHNLLVKPGTGMGEISRIISHPQALAQCRKYLIENLSRAELISVASTADAACRVAESIHGWAAIGTVAAARAYGLVVADYGIQDQANNATRFIRIGHDSQMGIEPAKTSLLLYLPDKPGALFMVLEQFYRHNLNLSKIESRPAKTRMGDYLFFIDIDGSTTEDPVSSALAAIKPLALELRVLGSYPKAPLNLAMVGHPNVH